jgi:hypothetical protein
VNVFKEQLLSLIHRSRPLTEVIIGSNEFATTFQLDESGGWVYRLKSNTTWRRMCWLPYKRRYRGVMACWGQKVVIGAASGIVTIIDFSNV